MNPERDGVLGEPDVTPQEIAQAMGRAIADAIRDHKHAGNPIAVWDWEENRAVLIPPDQIEIPGVSPERAEIGTVESTNQA